MNIVIVEDDADAAARLKNFLTEYSKEERIAFEISCCADGETFLKKYRKERAGIVFLDIELPNIDGMSVARQIREIDASVVIIFVTKMVQFAAKGYEVNALDFLVKPVAYADFRMKMRRAVNIALSSEVKTILVPADSGFYRVSSDKIVFVEVLGHKIRYQLVDGAVEVRGTLSQVEKSLEGHGFLRCNNCYLINSKYVDAVHGYDLIINGYELKISHPRRKEFMRQLMDLYSGDVKLKQGDD